MPPLVSVIIPTYNSRKYVLMSSILTQAAVAMGGFMVYLEPALCDILAAVALVARTTCHETQYPETPEDCGNFATDFHVS